MSLHGDNPTTACAHKMVIEGGHFLCAICDQVLEMRPCPACKGTGLSPVRDGTETCDECDGSGDGEWEVVA